MADSKLTQEDYEELASRNEHLNLYGVDLKERRIYFVGFIENESDKVPSFIKGFQLLDSTEGPITVWISCIGGEVEAGLSIYDTIRAAKNPVTTIGCGAIQSMAALVFQAGDTRILTENCRFMLHDGTISVNETSPSAAAATAKEAERLTSLYYRLIAERSRQPLSKVRAWGQKETYMSAKQAVRARFADGVLKNREPFE